MKVIQAVRKELLEILHDRTMLLVLAVFPIFIMLFMGSSFGSLEILGLPVGIVGPSGSEFSTMLFGGLNQSSAFKLHTFDSEQSAMEEFRNGRLRAVIIIPDDFDRAILDGNGTEVIIAVDNSDISLQEAIVAAIGPVVQASSTNITRAYVSSAWAELYALNDSAASLSSELEASKAGMEEARENLARIKTGTDSIEIGRLERSLEAASEESARLRGLLSGGNDTLFLEDSRMFLQNTSMVLNESIATVNDAHGRLEAQADGLNQTLATLTLSITGLEIIRNTTSDPIAAAALDINIATLRSMRNSTESQLADTQEQAVQLEGLNATLNSFVVSLGEYSAQLDEAEAGQSEAMEEADRSLEALNSSFTIARDDVAELKELMDEINSTAEGITRTLDDALVQAEDVNGLILSLQGTVAKQTEKNPETIATPLSVVVENQYARDSFVDFIIPQVIAVSMLFSCFLLASISLVREKTRKTVVRLLMIPGALSNTVIAKAASVVLISMGQVAIIVLIATMVFSVKPPADILMLAMGTAISALVLSSIGILVGFYARTESAAIQTSLLIAIPMLFLGNIIFSPDLLPAFTRTLLQLLPLAHITNIFKVVLITNGDPTADFVALLSYFMLLAAVIAFILIRRKDITNYTG